MIADYAERNELALPKLDAGQVGELAQVLPSYANLVNPLDFTTAIWGDGEALNRMLDSALRTEADAAMLVLDYPAEFTGERKECDLLLDLYCKALVRHGKTGFVTSAFPGTAAGPRPRTICTAKVWRHCKAWKTAWLPGGASPVISATARRCWRWANRRWCRCARKRWKAKAGCSMNGTRNRRCGCSACRHPTVY